MFGQQRKPRSAVYLGLIAALLCCDAARAADPKLEDLADLLEPLRAKHDLPALAAAVIVGGKVKAAGAVGVRKHGADVPVTGDDRFHLGSCTKAMTATLVAKLVEDGKLTWDTTLAEALPDLAEGMHEGYRSVTIRHLLCHRAGLPHEAWPPGMNFFDVHGLPGPPRQQRHEYAKRMLAVAPEYEPGSKFVYANAGFAIAGAIAEKTLDKPWETLIQEMVFTPLGITSAGFGAMGSPGKIDQPWQHQLKEGAIVPTEPGPPADNRPAIVPTDPGPLADNPPAIAPAGTVHMSVTDWAKFVADQVNEGKKKDRLLKPETYRTLHKAPFGGDYAFGWVLIPRPWAEGEALTHAGSNNSNFAVVWAVPKRGFAVLVMTNIAGEKVPAACDAVVWTLMQKFLFDR